MENKPEICHENYRVVFEDEELYVDNQSRKRSGYMTHAMTELSSDAFIDFNSNCSAVRLGGHSAYGWVEYRISEDNGRTYGETRVFPYSWESFLDGEFTVSVEKTVTCDDGTVVAFCLRNTMLEPCCCEPWLTPMCCIGTDNGQTWQKPYECIPYPGRIYDAVYRDGVIYALIFCNERFAGASKENV